MVVALTSLFGCCLAAMLCACAFDVIHVEQYPARLEASGASVKPFLLTDATTIDIGAGFRRELKAGTRWRCVGRLPQGDVYMTSDQILTVEASNIQEAYIVIDSRKLVGFYLPVEKTFSPLILRTDLVMKELP